MHLSHFSSNEDAILSEERQLEACKDGMTFDRQSKEIQIILSHRYVLSSQFKPIQSITQPPTLLSGWEGSLGRCSRWQFTRKNYILFELSYF